MFMTRQNVLATVFLLLTALVSYGQPQTASKDVYIKGWTVGNEIREQMFTFDLDSSNKEQSQIVRDYGAGSYKLILKHFPAREEYEWSRAYWVVQLKPFLGKYPFLSQDKKQEKLGNNLLNVDGPGPQLAKEDFVGYLYPKENPSNVVEKILGLHFYPISSRRVVKVNNFFVIIKVNSYKMNDRNPKEIDSMNVTVEFKNHYKSGEVCE